MSEVLASLLRKILAKLDERSDWHLSRTQPQTYGKEFPIVDGGDDFIEEDVGASEIWICPEGIYEVFGYITLNDALYDLNYRLVAVNVNSDCWFPIQGVGGAAFEIYNVDPVSGDVSGVLTQLASFHRASHGWKMSTGEGLFSGTPLPWRVRFRRTG